jgi:hypothetical protein
MGMSNLWLKIRIWSKIAIVVLFLIYALLFIYNNSGKHIDVWLWGTYEASLLGLMFFTFLAGVLTTILVRTTFRTIRQIRELIARSRAENLEREMADMKTKTQRLQTKPTSSDAANV